MWEWNPTPPETEIWKDQVPPRFVRGLQNEGPNVPAARWNACKEWREKEKIDSILDEPQPHYEAIKKYYIHGYYGRSKDGRLIYIEQPGLSELNKLKETGITADIQLRHFLYITEACWRVLSPDQDSTIVTIYDLQNLSISDFAGEKLELFKLVSKIYQAHYVERSGDICLINSAFWFRMAWKIISPFVHENTRRKIHIWGSDYQKLLADLLGAENLPTNLGGTNSLSLRDSHPERLILTHVREVVANQAQQTEQEKK